METFFGFSAERLMIFMLAAVGIMLLGVAFLALRNPLLIRMAVRNIRRRPARTVLILCGLTLSTIIITSSLITGDTIAHASRSEALARLGSVDEIVSVHNAPAAGDASAGADGLGSLLFFETAHYDTVRQVLTNDQMVDGISAVIRYDVVLLHEATGQVEPGSKLFAPDQVYDSEFGDIRALDGSPLPVASLMEREVYINQTAADNLQVLPGDQVEVYLGLEPFSFKVRSVADNYGLLSNQPTVILPLSEAQSLLDMSGRVTNVLISNQGDALTGTRHSETVTERLRVLLVDQNLADLLAGLLREPLHLAVVTASAANIPGEYSRSVEQVNALLEELGRSGVSDQLLSLLANPELNIWFMTLDLPEDVKSELGDYLRDLSILRVDEAKVVALAEADLLGNFFTSIFFGLGLIAIYAGFLLIFLIFVMLAAERVSEMGLMRAVGTQRRHLVQVFAIEGLFYDLMASVIGLGVGVLLSYGIVEVITRAFATFTGTETTVVEFYVAPVSLVISFCLGLLITAVVVTGASWRVSRLSIVAAIRDLPQETTNRRNGRLARLWRVVVGPLFILWGMPLIFVGHAEEQKSLVLVGYTLIIVGLALFTRWLLGFSSLRAGVQDRVGFLALSLGLLLFWSLPYEWRDAVTGVQDYATGVEIFLIAGVVLVAAAIWLVVYSADLPLYRLSLWLGRFSNLAPAVKTAVAYPLRQGRFRSALTIAMFALVVFMLIVMAVLAQASNQSFVDLDALTGGFDIQATLPTTTSLDDLRVVIPGHPQVPAAQIEIISGVTELPVAVRQKDSSRPLWQDYRLVGYDDDYISQVRPYYNFKLRAAGYDTNEAIWDALQQRNDVAVVSGLEVPFQQQARYATAEDIGVFWLEDVYQEDAQLPIVSLELQSPHTGKTQVLQVIGVLDWGNGIVGAVQTNEQVLQALNGEIVYPNTYLLKVRDVSQTEPVAHALERAFMTRGLNAVPLKEVVSGTQAGSQSFTRLLRGFLALGLFIGIAALGVITARAVVERRRQIGMLRAIGFQRNTIVLSFFLESTFIALAGIAIGAAMGLITAWNMVVDYYSNQPGVTLNLPWLEIGGIILLAYLFSQITTIIPALQASRIYPAQVLRYE